MSASKRSQYWGFARVTWLLNLVAIVVGLLVAAITIGFYVPILAWFGFIYLIASTIALAGLLLVPARSLDAMTSLSFLLWFAVSGLLTVMLTFFYAAVISAPSSGTPNDTVIVIQLVHSGIFFALSLLVAALWQLWRTLRVKAAARAGDREAAPSGTPSPAR